MTKIWNGALRRAGAALLACVLLLGLLPQLPGRAQAAYTDSYLQKMVDWGFMRGDIAGNLHPDNPISRAEFVTIINRALGYERLGGDPFQDVPESAWYAEDVDIAYTEGYISGTSETTFSPDASITREEAAIILTRNLMLQPATGENTSFTDSRELSEWSRGYITTAAKYGLINGYPDGSFRPKNSITRGEAAILAVKAIGTPVQTAGEHSLGAVGGNVTITASGVTLRDTVVGGNLYITGGVELGEITLENVTVLGEIVISGGGLSEGGDDSIVLRNVDAPKLIVDNLSNQKISVRVEGDGVIDNTSVRTDAFLNDRTPAGYGLSQIVLEGEDGLSLQLAGNIKTVTNRTPQSSVSVASGRADTINVDERATGSTLNVTAGAEVDNVNLDVATSVTGSGDIGHLTVNAPGSTVTMLPDQITIRPGVNATINGENMDSAAAAESSADPRLLAGFPEITDLAPTSATARFSANKKGTVYWALTSVTDGSVGADELLNPSSYSPKVVKSGTLSLTGSSQPGSVKISGLTSDGSYYLSSVYVDARNEQSPLKVISFTTPDDTVPNFASGYPYLSKITSTAAQVTAMATKTCRLYWAVLPKGAAAPTANDFKANAVTGNLGFGTLDVTKNTSYSFDVNNVPLEELESYDLYLWLTDVDVGQSSAVKKLSFTTVDGTPPRFNTNPTVNKVETTSVGLYANLNEAGTLYWVVVKHGEEYPKPLAGQTGKVDLSSENAKLQVRAGMNALKSGNTAMTEGKDVNFTVSGLEKESAYDLYYVAVDKAGNYSEKVGMITIHTADPNAPTVTQEFTKYNGTDTTTPLPNTDVRLVFSEAIQDAGTNQNLYELYQQVAAGTGDVAKLAGLLRESIKLYQDTGNGPATQVVDYKDDKANWTINYEHVEIRQEEGKTVIVFPGSDENGKAALNLQSGATYYFEIEAGKIADTSESKNVMGKTTLDKFTTVFAQVSISSVNQSEITTATDPQPINVNAVWKLDPLTTNKVGDFIDWDMLIWSDTTITFDIYQKKSGDANWSKVNENSLKITQTSTSDGYIGVSMTKDVVNANPTTPEFEQLNQLEEGKPRQYAIKFTSVDGETEEEAWNGRVNIKISVVAGSTNDLWMLANDVTNRGWQENVTNGDVTDIGIPADFLLKIPFTDQSEPKFASGYPLIEAGSSTAEMRIALTRNGTIYYVVAPMGSVPTEGYNPSAADKTPLNYGLLDNWKTLPDGNGIIETGEIPPTIIKPEVDRITAPEKWISQNTKDAKYGNVGYSTIEARVSLEDLIPNQEYIAYFVLQNTAQKYSEVLCYRFKTSTVNVPYITLTPGDGSVSIKTSEKAYTSYMILTSNDASSEPLLSAPFGKTAVDASGNRVPSYILPAKYDEFKAKYDVNMTILEAMSKTRSEGLAYEGPSLFDEYATDAMKEQVGQWVRKPNNSLSVDAEVNFITQKDTETPKEFRDKLKEGVSYTCIAVAYNYDDGKIDGFKALDGITVRDKQPPTLMVSNNSQEEKKGPGKWSGVVTLTFSETLYWQSNTSDDMKTLLPVYGNGANGITAKNILDCISAPPGTQVDNAQAAPGSVFRLHYYDISIGDTITLFAGGGLVSDQVPNPRGQITLKYVGDLGLITGNKDVLPGFVIYTGKIDGDVDDRSSTQ